ncbi:regulatory protein RecX [Pseudonocardia phyllosphaerae]|uniref:regulatory protein RecX n=1 Tax=Pseudonocardia phyllosphaerae TaxID=3390502 RepID=UPI00397E0C9B
MTGHTGGAGEPERFRVLSFEGLAVDPEPGSAEPGEDAAGAPDGAATGSSDGAGPAARRADPWADGLPEPEEPARRYRVASFAGLENSGAGGTGSTRRTGRTETGTDTDTGSGEPTGSDAVIATGRSGGGGGRGSGSGRNGSRRRGGRGTGTDTGSGTGDDRQAPQRTPAEEETRAKDICLRLLTDRARTVKELRDALLRKEVPEDVADGVLARFDEVGLVDDAAFADQWVRSRHRHRGLGRRAIARELHRKGVDREIADEALTGIDEDSERERARELVSRKLRSLPVGTREERQSTARKLVGMLARKGYGPGVAYGVVKEEIAAAGADAEELGEAPPED